MNMCKSIQLVKKKTVACLPFFPYFGSIFCTIFFLPSAVIHFFLVCLYISFHFMNMCLFFMDFVVARFFFSIFFIYFDCIHFNIAVDFVLWLIFVSLTASALRRCRLLCVCLLLLCVVFVVVLFFFSLFSSLALQRERDVPVHIVLLRNARQLCWFSFFFFNVELMWFLLPLHMNTCIK